MKLWDLVAAALTPRELQIAYLHLDGYQPKEIATRLKMSHRTVKAKFNSLYKKFNIGRYGPNGEQLQYVVLAVTLYNLTYKENEHEITHHTYPASLSHSDNPQEPISGARPSLPIQRVQ